MILPEILYGLLHFLNCWEKIGLCNCVLSNPLVCLNRIKLWRIRGQIFNRYESRIFVNQVPYSLCLMIAYVIKNEYILLFSTQCFDETS